MGLSNFYLKDAQKKALENMPKGKWVTAASLGARLDTMWALKERAYVEFKFNPFQVLWKRLD